MHFTGALVIFGAVILVGEGFMVKQQSLTKQSEYEGSPELAKAAAGAVIESFMKIVENLLDVIKRFDDINKLVNPEKEVVMGNAKAKVSNISDAAMDRVAANVGDFECKLKSFQEIRKQKDNAYQQIEECMEKAVEEFHSAAEAFYAYAEQAKALIAEARKEIEECEKKDIFLVPLCVGEVAASFISRSAVYVVTLPIYLLRGEKLFINTKYVLTQCADDRASMFEEAIKKILDEPCKL